MHWSFVSLTDSDHLVPFGMPMAVLALTSTGVVLKGSFRSISDATHGYPVLFCDGAYHGKEPRFHL